MWNDSKDMKNKPKSLVSTPMYGAESWQKAILNKIAAADTSFLRLFKG